MPTKLSVIAFCVRGQDLFFFLSYIFSHFINTGLKPLKTTVKPVLRGPHIKRTPSIKQTPAQVPKFSFHVLK